MKPVSTDLNWLFNLLTYTDWCLAWRCRIWSSHSAFSRVFSCHPSNNNGSSASCGVTPMPSSLFWYLITSTIALDSISLIWCFVWLSGDRSQFGHMRSHRSWPVIPFSRGSKFIFDSNRVEWFSRRNDHKLKLSHVLKHYPTARPTEPWSWGIFFTQRKLCYIKQNLKRNKKMFRRKKKLSK